MNAQAVLGSIVFVAILVLAFDGFAHRQPIVTADQKMLAIFTRLMLVVVSLAGILALVEVLG